MHSIRIGKDEHADKDRNEQRHVDDTPEIMEKTIEESMSEDNTCRTDDADDAIGFESPNTESSDTNSPNASTTSTGMQYEDDASINDDDNNVSSIEQDMYVPRADYDQLSDKLDRLMSEWENYRRRTAQDVQRSKELANENLIMALIPTIDNLERASKHLVKSDSESSDAIASGIAAVYKSLLNSLRKEGLTIISPSRNDAFDASKHQAVRLVETALPDDISGKVCETLQNGYELNGKVLRPAVVTVYA